jgi:hypothetical protein
MREKRQGHIRALSGVVPGIFAGERAPKESQKGWFPVHPGQVRAEERQGLDRGAAGLDRWARKPRVSWSSLVVEQSGCHALFVCCCKGA